MEAAIRWSTNSTSEKTKFLIADVADNRLRVCNVESVTGNKVKYRTTAEREKLPNFTAFDWSKTNESYVAIGTASGEARILQIDAQKTKSDFVSSFPVKTPRKCNSIAFSKRDLLATGLDRTRNDPSLNIYDLQAPSNEPLRRLSGSEVVSNVKFFSDQPDLLLAGISRQGVRMYDLRDSSNPAVAFFPTRNVHFLSNDPLDENYFASAGPAGENVVSIWDRRSTSRNSTSNFTDPGFSSAVLEVRPAVDTMHQTHIWSVRYSGYRRGCFGVLSSAGQIRLFEVTNPLVTSAPQELSEDNMTKRLTASNQYMRRTHELHRPWIDSKSRDSTTRPIAFDFVDPHSMIKGECVLTLCQNRELEVASIPLTPRLVVSSPKGAMGFYGAESFTLSPLWNKSTIAEDLIAVQIKARQKTLQGSATSDSVDSQAGASDALNQRSPSDKETAKLSSRDRHEELLFTAFPKVKLEVEDALTISSMQRRRCQEGYLFDCERNKEIVKNDPWLVELWDVVKRLEDLSKRDGMLFETVDLSYLGVHSLWTSEIGPNANRRFRRDPSVAPDISAAIKWIRGRGTYPPFEGAQTRYPDRRQLCLAICGWRFSDKRLREKCDEIVMRGEYYKAIVVAFCHGRKDVALDLLKGLIRDRKLQNVGLGAVIASETINKEQRHLCSWMAEEAEDPYLKTVLSYYVTGDWNTVIAMTELPLVYRVAIALKYLDDESLTEFIETATIDAIGQGDTEGIVLTGLGEQSMDLFQNYIALSNDLQTAVLATAFTNPQYVDDHRWQMWKEAYFMSMQAWRAFVERTRFTVQHNRRAVGPDGRRLIQPPPRQVTLRCNNCQGSLARQDEGRDESDDDTTTISDAPLKKGPLAAAGTVCPKCYRPMPRCAICMMWLGTPDSSKSGSVAELAKGDPMAKIVTFCMSCGHGCHAHHAKEWFTKHQICPVPSCQCVCGAKH